MRRHSLQSAGASPVSVHRSNLIAARPFATERTASQNVLLVSVPRTQKCKRPGIIPGRAYFTQSREKSFHAVVGGLSPHGQAEQTGARDYAEPTTYMAFCHGQSPRRSNTSVNHRSLYRAVGRAGGQDIQRADGQDNEQSVKRANGLDVRRAIGYLCASSRRARRASVSNRRVRRLRRPSDTSHRARQRVEPDIEPNPLRLFCCESAVSSLSTEKSPVASEEAGQLLGVSEDVFVLGTLSFLYDSL